MVVQDEEFLLTPLNREEFDKLLNSPNSESAKFSQEVVETRVQNNQKIMNPQKQNPIDFCFELFKDIENSSCPRQKSMNLQRIDMVFKNIVYFCANELGQNYLIAKYFGSSTQDVG